MNVCRTAHFSCRGRVLAAVASDWISTEASVGKQRTTYATSNQTEKRLRTWPKNSNYKIKGSKNTSHSGSGTTPTWLTNIHKGLMMSVKLPAKEVKSIRDYSLLDLPSKSTDQLLSLAQTIRRMDSNSMNVVVALWRRLDQMSIEEALQVADVFLLNRVQVPWYSSAFISYLVESLTDLDVSPNQLTRLMIHILQHPSVPPFLLLRLEEKLFSTFDQFSLGEIAVVCQLFFFGKNRIRSVLLVDKIASKVLLEFGSLQPEHLPMLMKTFRYSNYIKISFYKELGNRLVSSNFLSRCHNMGQIMHVAYTFACVRITHEPLFKSILNQCHGILTKHTREPNLAEGGSYKHRIKDVGKIFWACGTLTVDQESLALIHAIIDHMRTDLTDHELMAFPDNVVDLLHGLALLGVYPYDLLDRLLQPEVVSILLKLNKDREKHVQLEFLDRCIAIECPDYTGACLSAEDRRTIKRHCKDLSVEVDMELKKSVKPILAALSEKLGDECVHCGFLDSHYNTSDILLAWDRKSRKFISPLNPETHADESIVRLVLLVLSQAQTSYDGHVLGLLRVKVRQLLKQGYHIIEVEAEEAMNFMTMSTASIQTVLMESLHRAIASMSNDPA